MKTCTLRLLCLFVLFISLRSYSQVKIGDNAKTINPNSLLELESSTKGLLLPRLTNDQIAAMTNVPTGMLLFSSTDSALYVRRDTGWAVLELRTKPADSTWTRKGSNLVTAGGIGNVGIGTTTPFSQLSNTPNNVLDEQGSGGDYNSLAWVGGSNTGYAAMISSPQSRGLLVKTAGTTSTSNAFEVMSGGVNSLSVKANGNVGIGTASPAAKLDVKGNVSVTGDVSYSGTLNMGVQYVVKSDISHANNYSVRYVGCPTGYKLIGGGGGAQNYDIYQRGIIMNSSGPNPDNNNEWKILLTNTSNNDVIITYYAICAKVQ